MFVDNLAATEIYTKGSNPHYEDIKSFKGTGLFRFYIPIFGSKEEINGSSRLN